MNLRFPRVIQLLRSLEGDRTITFRLLKSWALAGNIKQVKKCVCHYENFPFSTKAR